MTISQSTTVQAYQLNAGGSRARIAILRMIAADSVNNFNESTRLRPGDWRGARHWTIGGYAAAYGMLGQGRNGDSPVWYCHTGPYFRNERDAHEIIRSRGVSHGWYTDGDGRELAIGIVGRLSRGRFIAGYRWTSNDERVYYPEVFTDEDDAARMADEHARVFAESAREDSERFDAMRDAEIAQDDALEALRDTWALRRQGRRDSDDVREAIETLREARETLAEATDAYNKG